MIDFFKRWLWLLSLGQRQSAAGVDVTEQTSLQCMAVFACVRILAETVGSLPLVTYRRLERGKERATSHSLYPLLHDLPNPEMSSIELRETLMGHLGLWGNAYAEIELNRAGRVVGLWPLRPDKTTPRRVNGKLTYEVQLSGGQTAILAAERVLHLRGLGYDGIVGYNPISLARQAIGLSLATEEFGARFFGNGARPGTVLEHPGKLSDAAIERLRQSVESAHGGLEKSHRLMILEEGMKIESIGVPPEDAQFLETRKFQLSEIARLYRIPSHMINDLDRATFSNIEQQSLEFVTYTLQPWLTRWEQAIYRDLLTPAERTEYFAEHLLDALLRGDTPSRYQAYSVGRQNGWLSANDIRERENMNPIEGGDVYLVPLNMVDATQLGAEEQGSEGAGEQGSEEVGEQGSSLRSGAGERLESRDLGVEIETRAQGVATNRRRLIRPYQRLINEAVTRVVRREVADVGRAAQKFMGQRDVYQFSTWLKTFYEEHKAFWVRQIMPVLLSYADQVGVDVGNELSQSPRTAEDIRQFIDDYAAALADREAGSSQLQLQALLDEALSNGGDPLEMVNTRLGEWDEKRADKTAEHEAHNMVNALALAFYLAAGVRSKRWVTTGENCPYCRHLNGAVLEIEKFFLEKDTDFLPEGATAPLNKRHSVGHPPIHGGCDCLVVAG